VESIYIILHKDNQSAIDWVNTLFDFENLSLHRVNEAYLELMGLNQPSNVHARAPVFWWLPTPSNQSHQMEATIEFTYFNGTVHKKVIQPFQLSLIGKETALNRDPFWRNINWVKNFLRPVVHTVDLVHIFSKKGLHIVLDVKLKRDIHSGVNVSYMFVPKTMKLNTVVYAMIFHVTCLWISMIQSMDREVPLRELGSWHIERKLGQRNTLS